MTSTEKIADKVPWPIRQQWINDGTYPNKHIFQMFVEKARQTPEKDAIRSPSISINYQQLLTSSLKIANGLRKLGIKNGDIVAYQLPNSWKCCAIDLAVAAIGAIVLPFPPGRGKSDIKSILHRSRARALIVEHIDEEHEQQDLIDYLHSTCPNFDYLIITVDKQLKTKKTKSRSVIANLLDHEPLPVHPLMDIDPNQAARILVSSGSESEPKLVAYSHNALLGGRGRFLQNIHPDTSSMNGFYLVPLGSAFGSTATIGMLCWMGGCITLLEKFDVQQAIYAIAHLHPTHVLGVPTMFQRIMADESLKCSNRSSLIALVSGGACIDATTVKHCLQAFGCHFLNLYGSADGVNCHNTISDDLDTVLSTVGKPNEQVCSIKIIDEARQTVPKGKVGEIVARGALSPLQYLNAPDLDKRYRDSEGWVYTGDLGYLNEKGYLVLSGRKKDIIIRGGINISPIQIEHAVMSHDNIVSAACIAIADPDMGQRVCLCLSVKYSQHKPALSEISHLLLAQGLEKNKHPEYLRYYPKLPLNPAGKINKQQLAEDLQALSQFMHPRRVATNTGSDPRGI